MDVEKLKKWMISTRKKELSKNSHRIFHDSRFFPCRICKKLREEIKELESLN